MVPAKTLPLLATTAPHRGELARAERDARHAWVDGAKGLCIIAVVTLYATHELETTAGAQGWLHRVVEFSRPFRMPDFFFLSGLFVARVLTRPWRAYFDSKVLHFLYFYAVWVTLKFAFAHLSSVGTWPLSALLLEYARGYVDPPSGPLWFIHLLALFFTALWLTRGVPPWLVLSSTIALRLALPETGWKVVDRFAEYAVFIYAGHLLAPVLFVVLAWVQRRPGRSSAALGAWALINGLAVWVFPLTSPLAMLALGFAGAAAVMISAALLSSFESMAWLQALGERSLVIYLAFPLPLAIVRRLLGDQPVALLGTTCVLAVVWSIAGALALSVLVRSTPLGLLFERPSWATLRR